MKPAGWLNLPQTRKSVKLKQFNTIRHGHRRETRTHPLEVRAFLCPAGECETQKLRKRTESG